ncbi:MAG: ABC transporter permease [Actinomycetota bacterium]
MNLTYYRLELRRLRRDYVTMFFTAGLPAFLYVIFGASPDYGDDPVRDGNVAMWIMIAMAGYGAVTATTGIGGMAAVERMQGWGRQLGLTPLSDGGYVRIKAATAITIAAIPIALVYTIGAFTGAEAPLSVWIISAAILLVGATTFALYGLSFGLAFRSEAAVSAASGSLVVLSFLGNIFIPVSGWQLTLAKFTPLYGYVSLARRALTGGATIDTDTGDLIDVPLWQPLTNVVVWTAILAVAAVILVGRGRARQ